MTKAEQRAYVQQWAETGRLLDQMHWREVKGLDEATALAATDALIEAALAVPMPPSRQSWSGLAEQQARFHRRVNW